MCKHRMQHSKILTTVALTFAWIILSEALPTTTRQSQSNAIDSTRISVASERTISNSSSTGLSRNNALQLLVALYSGRIPPLNISQVATLGKPSIQSALLDYENKTEVEDLEKIVTHETASPSDIELPPDVYEVSAEVWWNESEILSTASQGKTLDETQLIITEALRAETTPAPEPEHIIRHRTRRVAIRNPERRDEGVAPPPADSPNTNEGNILNRHRQQQGSNAASHPLQILQQRESFNMTVDYQTPFQNIDKDKLLEIVLLMNLDCRKFPKRKIVRWVSGMRGILFECQNGAWVVTYLSRRNRKPRPTAVSDCHEIHLQGKDLYDNALKHQFVIIYSNGERKSKDVFCKHDDRHTNHQLIDNHINADPNQPVLPLKQTMAGAWTVIQRREHGGTKFYRSLKRYKRGFGSVESGEYWLGLEALHEATHTREYMLRVEVTTGNNVTYYSEYDRFRVGSEAKSYRLRLGDFIKPVNGSLSSGDFLTLHHGGRFHTRDSTKFAVNCARLYGTAFWFRGCWAAVNLNGPYIDELNNSGVRWATANPNEVRRVWKTEMMIKPIL